MVYIAYIETSELGSPSSSLYSECGQSVRMAGAMIDRAQVARQLKADGLVQVASTIGVTDLTFNLTLQAADMERQAALREGKIKKIRR